MKRGFLTPGLVILGIAVFFGILAASDYQDPIGVSLLMFWTWIAGVCLGMALMGG